MHLLKQVTIFDSFYCLFFYYATVSRYKQAKSIAPIISAVNADRGINAVHYPTSNDTFFHLVIFYQFREEVIDRVWFKCLQRPFASKEKGLSSRTPLFCGFVFIQVNELSTHTTPSVTRKINKFKWSFTFSKETVSGVCL